MVRINNDYFSNTVSNFNSNKAGNILNTTVTKSFGISLRLDALFSTANAVTGESTSVYYDETYTKDNPIMIVKGEDRNGDSYEQKVNIKDISPANASYIEMVALSTYLYEQGQINSPDIGINTNDCSQNDMFAKQDFISPLRQMMEWQLGNKSMYGYTYFADKLKVLEKWGGMLPLFNEDKNNILGKF